VDEEGLPDQYRRVLLEMHEARVEAGGGPRRWNRLAGRLQVLHLDLRASEEGRRAIFSLMADSNPTVRCWAAAHSLFWDESTARGVLEREACDEQSIGGFDAKMALREFNAGRLNTTWEPRRGRRGRQGSL